MGAKPASATPAPVGASAAQQQQRQGCAVATAVKFGCIFVAVAAAITVFVLGGVYIAREYPNEDPVFSVAVAGIAGLDPARDLAGADRPTLSPSLNLTFHISNARNWQYPACVASLSTATVSYGDVFLARGSVPEFCARPRRESEGVARAWAEDVAVPRFLQDQVAAKLTVGDAAVDVLTTWNSVCLACSKVKVAGGGLSRCEVADEVACKRKLCGLLNPAGYTC